MVKPLRFPGGSIGELAVNGTVNDLAMAGARPLALSLALILEEGLDAGVLRAEVDAIAAAAEAAGVRIATGDTKVVERGHADGMYVCTTGVGARDPRAELSPGALRPGDRILVSGPIGAHGTAIMLARGELGLDADIESDTRSLWPAVDAILGPDRRTACATRRAAASPRCSTRSRAPPAWRWWSTRRRCRSTPPSPGPRRSSGSTRCTSPTRACSSPSWPPEAADAALAALREVDGCERAAEIGEVKTEPPGMVLVNTAFGGRRVMDQLVGDPLPRIC